MDRKRGRVRRMTRQVGSESVFATQEISDWVTYSCISTSLKGDEGLKSPVCL